MSLDSTPKFAGSNAESAPSPGNGQSRFAKGLLKCLSEAPESRWGTQLIRIAQDMMIVCDDNLEIQYHNQSFIKRLGYSEGSYRGRSLLEFFPRNDRDTADRAFEKLANGRMRGIEVEANFLTRSEPVAFVAEVTRSLRSNGSFYFYLIARPVKKALLRTKAPRMESPALDPFLRHASDLLGQLPIAAWRADGNHRITGLFGKLWDELSVDRKAAIGVDLSVADISGGPQILGSLKPSARAGRSSFVDDVTFDGRRYSVTVEPAIGAGGERPGSVGFICAAGTASPERIESGPVEGTRVTTLVVNSDTRKVATVDLPGRNDPSGIQPRALTPPTRLTPIGETMKREPLPLPKRPVSEVALSS